MNTAPLLEAEIGKLHGDDDCSRLVLDLRELTFMDSTGLHVAMSWTNKARNEGFEFGILPGPPEIVRVFEAAGVLDRLPFEEPTSGTESAEVG
jgi:anti-anti-sigma factor